MKFASLALIAGASAHVGGSTTLSADLMAQIQGTSVQPVQLQQLIAAAVAAKSSSIVTDSTSSSKGSSTSSSMIGTSSTAPQKLHTATTMTNGTVQIKPTHVATTMTGGSNVVLSSTIPTTDSTSAHKASASSMKKPMPVKTDVAKTLTNKTLVTKEATAPAASTLTNKTPAIKESTVPAGSSSLSADLMATIEGNAITKGKTVVPVVQKQVTDKDGKTSDVHCAEMPAKMAAATVAKETDSTMKKAAIKVKSLLNLTAAKVETPAHDVCSPDLHKVIAHVKANVTPSTPAPAVKADDTNKKGAAAYLTTGAAIATALFSMA